MSTYASSLDDAIRDPNQEVSFKIKPLQAPSSAGSSTGGSAQASATGAPAPRSDAPLGFGLNGMSVLDPSKQSTLKKNPQLAATPSTVQQDDMYAAQLAQARAQTTQAYLAMLRDIGFMDDNGQFLPGLIETEAARRRSALQQQQQMASDKVNNSAVRSGAFFSGRRAKNLAEAQDPYMRELSQLETDVPRLITDRYNDIGNLLSNFTLTQDQLLAELAARQAARAQAQPSGAIAPPPPASEVPNQIIGGLGGTSSPPGALDLNTLNPAVAGLIRAKGW